jgi:hypothetical protein
MSGLLSSASPWASSDTAQTKKRTPSLSISRNKTVKNTSRITSANGLMDDVGSEYNNTNDTGLGLSYDSIEDLQEKTQLRNSKVQDILQNMNTVDSDTDMNGSGSSIEDAGQGLANFSPLPLFSQPKPERPSNPSTGPSTGPKGQSISYYSLDSGSRNDGSKNNGPLGNSYYHAYSDKSKMGNVPYYSMDRMQNTVPNSNNTLNSHQDKILEKLNKMIYLLEEQQNEPTKHITEEFILYTFLGVFIIFIVDSFSKTGKYTR